MVRKSWNIVNIRKRLIDNQSTKIKNKIAVKVVKLCQAPDIIISRIDLGREKYHKLDFEINLPHASHLEILVLDPHGNVLAHGLSSETLLSLSFQTSYEWISVEIKAQMQRLNLYYYINRVIQNSCLSVPVPSKLLTETEALLHKYRDTGYKLKQKDGKRSVVAGTVLEGEGEPGDESEATAVQAIESRKNSVSYEDIWYLLPDLPLWDWVLSERIKGMDAFSHSSFLLKNRGNMLLRTFIGSKKLRENFLSKEEVWAPLVYSLPISEHYASFRQSYLKNFHGEESDWNLEQIQEGCTSLTERFESLNQELEGLKTRQEELSGEIELCKEERLARIAEVEILRERIMPDLENNNYYREISDKEKVLEDLKEYLMKDLLRQHRVKRVSERLIAAHKKKMEKEQGQEAKEAQAVLDNHNKGILMSYNLLGTDLLRIDKELKKVCGIKRRMEDGSKAGSKQESENLDDHESLLKEIEERTAVINAMTESLTEIGLLIENIKSRRWGLFSSYLENIIKIKLLAVYEKASENAEEKAPDNSDLEGANLEETIEAETSEEKDREDQEDHTAHEDQEDQDNDDENEEERE